nr:taste receptor type 2 member 19-like [Pogona vitticeps]
MPFPQVAAFLIAVADFALGGLISNGFLVTMMVMEWAKCKRLSSSGQLLLSIVNSTWSFILWCKQRISWLIPRLLVGALLVSFISSFSGFITLAYTPWSSVTSNVTNGTQGKKEIDYLSSFKLLVIITGNVCPFVVVLLCTILSVASLCRHLHHMTSGEPRFQSFQTKAHIKAIGTLVSLFFLYISWILASTLLYAEIQTGEIIDAFSASVMIFYSPVQAVILVLANRKLNQAATQILQRTQM